MTDPVSMTASYPYGQFVQALQHDQQATLPWVDGQLIVSMRDHRTNIRVTMLDADRFQLATVMDRFGNAITGAANEKIVRYTGKHNIPDATFDARQVGHVLKEIAQMVVNRDPNKKTGRGR